MTKVAGSPYIVMLLETLGSRDPMAVLESTSVSLRKAVAGLDDATVRRPEKQGKWSILDVAQHLADSELVCGYRIRMIVAHPTPPIQGFDQDLWARELNYSERRLTDALGEFASLREANLRLLRALGPEKLHRYGVHAERGEESVERMTRLYAGHDMVHLKQIERIKGAVSRKP